MFSNYQFRCSALGNIVSKSGKFTEGNKTYIQEVFIGELYKIKKEISSKYFEKGLFEEESGITLLNKALYPGSLCLKNKERKSNDFIHGEADCIKDGIVYDIKNAWDQFTFGKAELSHNYRWQLIGYMWLWECDKARLFYCLNNTPEHLLCAEERKMFYNAGTYLTYEDEQYLEDCKALRAKHNYDSLSLEERFKVWEIEKDNEEIETLKASIDLARKYMNFLYKEHQDNLKFNRSLMGYQPITIHEPQYIIHDQIGAV